MVTCPRCYGQVADGVHFCGSCGAPIAAPASAFTAQPGMPMQPGMPGGAPIVPDYLVWAILETILCCLPLGIAAIIYANQASTAKAVGNYAEAMQKANTAKQCIIWGVVGTLVLMVVYFILAAIAAS